MGIDSSNLCTAHRLRSCLAVGSLGLLQAPLGELSATKRSKQSSSLAAWIRFASFRSRAWVHHRLRTGVVSGSFFFSLLDITGHWSASLAFVLSGTRFAAEEGTTPSAETTVVLRADSLLSAGTCGTAVRSQV